MLTRKMSKILILQGLIAAGKTTFAKELVEKGWKRVNKDDIRAMIDNSHYSRQNEKLVLEIRDMIIDLSLINGYNVVVDDTNFEAKHFKQMALIADINEAELEVKSFKTPLRECIERDSKREAPVGEKLIRRMYDRYVAPQKSQ